MLHQTTIRRQFHKRVATGSMGVLDLNKTKLEEIVSGEGILLVDCWASWCGACNDFAPVFERVAGQFADHKFGKLDTQAESDFTKELGIENIPTLLLFRDGLMLFKQPGYFDEDKLVDVVKQAESLDMDMVRASIESELRGEAE